jgi:hypothetical protein
MPAKTDRIQDESLRHSMEEAKAALKSGDYKKVVDLTTVAYADLLRRNPAMTQGAAQIQNVMFFPRLGAHIQLNSAGQPEVIYDREKFSFSEAVTYLEFTVDSLVKNGA